MIEETLRHFRGIGPVRLQKLHEAGVRTWSDVIERGDRLPCGMRGALADESQRCLAALETGEIGYFVERFAPQDKWRILAQFLEQTSFFDIETAGLEYDAPITVIVCWHKGRLFTFVEHENLDEFLDLLDDVTLLASFNGGSFDVPRVLDSFHIPRLECPHLDLRWLCYHRGLRGGLKEIAGRLCIDRPADLQHASGELAIEWWAAWRRCRDASARQQLIRYCASDVLLLVLLAQQLAGRGDHSGDVLWRLLPAACSNAPVVAHPPSIAAPRFAGAFGRGGPSQLRARRAMLAG